MKKRIAATLLVGAIGVAGIVGLSACGNGSVSVPKGGEVANAEAWAKAFSYEAYADLDNFTVSTTDSAQSAVKGSLKADGESENVSATVKASSYDTTLYEGDGGYTYSESSSSVTVKASYNDEDFNYTGKSGSKNYYQLKENDNGNKNYYRVSYSLTEEKSDEGHSLRESYWDADTTSYMSKPSVTYYLSGYFQDAKEDKDVKTEGYIEELYELFEYAGGVYTANLYMFVNPGEEADLDLPSVVVECEVKVSIKDGIVTGYSVKANGKDTFSQTIDGVEYKFDYSVKTESVVAVTNVGDTNASRKANSDIKKAIEKYDKANKDD